MFSINIMLLFNDGDDVEKIIFIEGLPGTGKTYLVNRIKKMHISHFHIVDELIHPRINDPFLDDEYIFLENDELKVYKHTDGIVIIDRGPISTLVYNQVHHLINHNYDASFVENWFKQFENMYNKDNVYNYYLYTPDIYKPSIDDEKNPFGSIDNLKLTHQLTIYNLKKYAKNFKIIIYNQEDIEEVINEIIN